MFNTTKIHMSLLALLLLILPACRTEEARPLIKADVATQVIALPVMMPEYLELETTLISHEAQVGTPTPPLAPLTTPTPSLAPLTTPTPYEAQDGTPTPYEAQDGTPTPSLAPLTTPTLPLTSTIGSTAPEPKPTSDLIQSLQGDDSFNSLIKIWQGATQAADMATSQVIATQPPIIADVSSDLIGTLQAEGSFSILIKALQVNNLIEELENGPPITLIAPTDDAFNRCPPETLSRLLENPDVLKKTLLYHVMQEPISQEQLAKKTATTYENGTPIAKVRTIQGDTVTIANFGHELKINNAKIIKSDIETPNGSIIHGVDVVLQSVAFAKAEPPKGLIEQIEVWQPYKEGEQLPIGDAQLVPGASEMRKGVRALADVLIANEVQINIARTVVLEEEGEVAYLAPVVSKSNQASEEMIIGVIVIEGYTNLSAGAGSYAVQLKSQSPISQNEESQQQISLLNGKGESIKVLGPNGKSSLSIEQVLLLEELQQSEFPSAALFYGSRYCRIWNVCWQCDFFGPFAPYPTLKTCQDSSG